MQFLRHCSLNNKIVNVQLSIRKNHMVCLLQRLKKTFDKPVKALNVILLLSIVRRRLHVLSRVMTSGVSSSIHVQSYEARGKNEMLVPLSWTKNR